MDGDSDKSVEERQKHIRVRATYAKWGAGAW